MTTPETQTAALVASLASSKQSTARAALDDLLAWSSERATLLAFDTEPREQPHVRYNTADGNVFWLARGTSDGDAKIEIMTRTAVALPAAVLVQLHLFLDGILPAAGSGARRVLQVPMQLLAPASARARLESALDLALGAASARAAGDGADAAQGITKGITNRRS